MTQRKNVYDEIAERYHLMTRTHQKVADNLLDHRSSVPARSVAVLAEQCGVSPATVTRFAREMGYKNFTCLRLALARAAEQDYYENPDDAVSEQDQEVSFDTFLEQLCRQHHEAIEGTRRKLEADKVWRAVEMIHNADKVYSFGQGSSLTAAITLAIRFSYVSNAFIWLSDTHLKLMVAGKASGKELIIYFSYSGASEEAVEVLKLAREKGARSILVTHFVNAPAASFADLVIPCGPAESSGQERAMYTKTSQIVVIDVLFHCYCGKYGEETDASFRNTMEAALGHRIQD